MYVYIKTDRQLWTVGFYDPTGKYQTDSDHEDREEAAKRVMRLNGGNELTKVQQAAPDLLEVCKAMEKLFFMCGSGIYAAGGVIDEIGAARTQAKAAIAKAEG